MQVLDLAYTEHIKKGEQRPIKLLRLHVPYTIITRIKMAMTHTE